MFAIGDLAVYPAHGVGRIEAIEQKQFDGKIHAFYVMRILNNDMKIMIPKKNTENVGLRHIIEETEIFKIYDLMRDQHIDFAPKTWNRRYREYMDKIKTGSVYELAVVIRDMYLRQREKSLSFGEKKMLETALSLLVKEISLARGEKENVVFSEIEGFFSINHLVK
jgi:CarD family transcriptional regulator